MTIVHQCSILHVNFDLRSDLSFNFNNQLTLCFMFGLQMQCNNQLLSLTEACDFLYFVFYDLSVKYFHHLNVNNCMSMFLQHCPL